MREVCLTYGDVDNTFDEAGDCSSCGFGVRVWQAEFIEYRCWRFPHGVSQGRVVPGQICGEYKRGTARDRLREWHEKSFFP